MKSGNTGFTLVELAIVMTIIGLLIGGVLKGQELLQNARMTTVISQNKAFSGAALTFRDIYKAWPGDIQNPGNFIEGCTASPCNVSGNGDGTIGPLAYGNGGTVPFDDESNRFWLHLALAKLITGVDTNSTWTSGALYKASYPSFPLGNGKWMILMINFPVGNASYPNGQQGHHFYLSAPPADGSTYGLSNNGVSTLAKLDLKADDGKPWTGDYVLNTACGGQALGANTPYDPNNTTSCNMYMRAGF